MANSKLAIIIPAFSGLEQIRRCLECLYNSDYRDFDAIIVDHGINDEITRSVNEAFPRVICKRGSPDLWWSGASNLGIRHALERGSRWIMLLNHDCYVRPDTIGTLLKHMENKPHAVIAPVQHLQRSGRDIVGATSCFLLGFTTIIPPAALYHLRHSSVLIPVPLIAGGRGVVLAAEVFDKVGYLDEEHLPHYGADHDFYFRCRKAGYRLLACKDALVDIDDTMTTAADLTSNLSLQQFAASLKDRRSHRNIGDLNVLFSRYSPIPGLAPVGVALNTTRYFTMYLAKTLVHIVTKHHRHK
jgi:GT2 family glycosyltransferase